MGVARSEKAAASVKGSIYQKSSKISRPAESEKGFMECQLKMKNKVNPEQKRNKANTKEMMMFAMKLIKRKEKRKKKMNLK